MIFKLIIATWCIMLPVDSWSQQKAITLDSCYIWALQNYPLVKQYALLEKSTSYSLQNIGKGYLPQIQINGQVSYQSDVTDIPIDIPGMDIPKLNKDQYKIYVALNQPIYDGGLTRQQQKLQEATAIADQQNITVQLYQIRSRVSRLFFGILLLDEQIRQNKLMQLDIQSGWDKTKAAVANGSSLRSNADVLEADLLKASQQSIELKADRKAFTEMLGLFINRPLDEETTLERPKPQALSPTIIRPELLAFDYQNKMLDAKDKLLSVKNRPGLSLFAQGGFGKPALNIFSNSFDPYYIGGIKLTIPVTGFYTLKNERKLLSIGKKTVAVQKETFLFNTQFTLKQQGAEINKLREILKVDETIIPLRTNIKNAAMAQLDNGVINTNDYLREVHAEDMARQQKILHELQLLQAQYNQQITTGN